MSPKESKKQIRNKTRVIREALGGLVRTDANSRTHCHSCGGSFDFYRSLRNAGSFARKLEYHRPDCLYLEAMKLTYKIEKLIDEVGKP
jgi:hypothetical protein